MAGEVDPSLEAVAAKFGEASRSTLVLFVAMLPNGLACAWLVFV